MAVNPDDPTIAASCADVALPADLAADQACYQPTLLKGPIVNLYYTKTPFAADPTLTEINRRLALAGTDDEQLIGPIVVQVSRTPPTGNTIRVNGQDYDQGSNSQYQVTIQDMSQSNHDLMRLTQANTVRGHWYGVDANSKWRGGQNGLTGGPATLKLRENIPTGENDLQTATGTLSGIGKYDDAIMDSPVAPLYG